jgi:chromosome segregation ATPase
MSEPPKDEVLTRLLDAITPILQDLAKLPDRLEHINNQLASIDKSLTRIHERLDFLITDHEIIDKVIDDFEEAVVTIRTNNSLVSEKNMLEQEDRKNRRASDKIKWDRVTKIIIGTLGSGSVLYLVIEHILEHFFK